MIEGRRFPFDFSGYGVWSIDTYSNVVVFEGVGGATHTHPIEHPKHDGLFDLSFDTMCVPFTGYGVVVPAEGRTCFRINGHDGAIEPLTALGREDLPRGLTRVRFMSTSKYILMIFESGVVCLNDMARVVWKRTDGRLNDELLRLEEDRLVFTNEHRGTWAYDLNSGRVLP